MVYILKCKNSEVTDFYLDIIKEIFLNCGKEVCKVDNITKDIQKQNIIVASTALDVFKLYLKGYKKIFYWMQGIDAEESYLKHHSFFRKVVLSTITFFSIKKAKGLFCVSNEMKKFIEKKYHINSLKNIFIMPCFNTIIEKKKFFENEKYRKNVFTYIGSLSEWQCFEKTIDFYKKIENQFSDVELRIYTFSVDEAKRILEEKKVKKYTISCVNKDEIPNVLSQIKFGFCLRDDIKVNNVATPTKLSSYISSGVIPIFSSCIKDFYEVTSGMKYVIPIENSNTVPEKLIQLCKKEIIVKEIFSEYNELFLRYYNRELYIKKGKEWIGGFLSDY